MTEHFAARQTVQVGIQQREELVVGTGAARLGTLHDRRNGWSVNLHRETLALRFRVRLRNSMERVPTQAGVVPQRIR